MTPPFKPLALLGNPHLQTVVGQYLPRRRLRFPTTKRLVPFPDGDQVVIHDNVPPDWAPTAPAALLIHGMGGSHRSGYMERLALLLLEQGMRTLRVDLRGCGDSLPLSRRLGHGGSSADLLHLLRFAAELLPQAPLKLVGFSLGGNALLRMLAEEAGRLPPGTERAVAVNPPIDMERCSALLRQPRNRFYERYFIRDLWRQAKERERWFPEVKAPPFEKLDTLRRFDDLYTAPRCGFADASEYYAFASSAPRLSKIALPTLLLTARDDPFIAVESFETAAGTNPNLAVEIVPGGGHLGYVGRDGHGGVRWGDRRLVRALTDDGFGAASS